MLILAVALQTRIDMKYSKPGSGIPKSDLASDIQTSLGKADTAIQEQDLNDYQPKIDTTHKLDADLVDDTNSTNKFVTNAEKTQIETNTADISNIKDGTSIDSFGDVETVLSAKQTQIDNLQAENEALYNEHPDITSTGTNVTLNGTGDLKMKVDVGGNSIQVQYQGYNKLETELPTDTHDNVTITYNSDGSYTINGT